LILDDPNHYFSNKRCSDVSDFKKIKLQLEELKKKLPEEIKSDDRVKLDMLTVCKIFRAFRYKEYKDQCKHLKIFWDTSETGINVSNKRNFIVHQVQGMSEDDLWSFWGVLSLEDWQQQLLEFLNFIVKEDFSEGFLNLEQASLMTKVHEELEKAIEAL
jgi:tRNA(Ile)-lysidine synthase TilS/MesJ